MVALLIILAELIHIFPKTNTFAFLDKSLLHIGKSGDVSTDSSGNYTISTSVTESVWTVRNSLVVGLFLVAIASQATLIHRRG